MALAYKNDIWNVENATEAAANAYENSRCAIINLFKDDEVRKKLSDIVVNQFRDVLKERGENSVDYAEEGHDPYEYDAPEKRAKQATHKERSVKDIKNLFWEYRGMIQETKNKKEEQEKMALRSEKKKRQEGHSVVKMEQDKLKKEREELIRECEELKKEREKLKKEKEKLASRKKIVINKKIQIVV